MAVDVGSHTQTRAGHRAFSLLEVMFAGSILIIGLTAIAGVFAAARASFAHQRDASTATAIAEAFLEQVVILPASSPLLDAGTHPARSYGVDGRPSTSPTAPFLLTWTVTNDRPVVGMKEILVDVRWVHDREHHVKLFTYRE